MAEKTMTETETKAQTTLSVPPYQERTKEELKAVIYEFLMENYDALYREYAKIQNPSKEESRRIANLPYLAWLEFHNLADLMTGLAKDFADSADGYMEIAQNTPNDNFAILEISGRTKIDVKKMCQLYPEKFEQAHKVKADFLVNKIIGYANVLRIAREEKNLDRTKEYAYSDVTVLDAKKVLTDDELKAVSIIPKTYEIVEVHE